jgi:hypothetical protein
MIRQSGQFFAAEQTPQPPSGVDSCATRCSRLLHLTKLGTPETRGGFLIRALKPKKQTRSGGPEAYKPQILRLQEKATVQIALGRTVVLFGFCRYATVVGATSLQSLAE